jgi:pilus assembly protein CpaB
MNRSTRTFIVLAVAVGLASVATYLVYYTIKSRPLKEVEVASAFAVVAAHPLPMGTRLAAGDVKLVPWPAANPVSGGFTAVDQVVDRGIVAPVAENEPLNANNVASKEAGAGLPPTIPPGMRAISVRVNEVIGVAGYVVPSTHVDVMVILRQQGSSLARVVVSNVQVLAAGTNIDQEAAKQGKAIPSSVVTLLLSPEDAQKVGLAAAEGQIMLTLRNPMDAAPTTAQAIRTANLMGGDMAPVPAATPTPAVPRARKAVVAPAPVPEPPPAPKIFKVEMIRGGKRTEEIIK